MSGNHDHTHDRGGHRPEPISRVVARTKAIESLLIEKGLVSSDVVDKVVSRYEQEIGPLSGAKIVARAWVEPQFKRWLLADGTAAIESMGFGGHDMVVLENTPTIHNVVVCTLCSCYPWAVLGLPPTWYKDFAYRSRVVIEPRKVLAEFGLQLDDSIEIRVWDSSAELRYLVLPERPAGTERMSETELAAIVTRDSMIGVTKVKAPVAV